MANSDDRRKAPSRRRQGKQIRRKAVVDRASSSKRSAQMALIGSKNSKFERAVRAGLHAAGYRYKLHVRGLPGTPDLVFPARRKIVFLHSCFWHGHGCRLSRMPKSNKSYWTKKIASNRARDARNERALRRSGWRVLSVWECKYRQSPEKTVARLGRFLQKM